VVEPLVLVQGDDPYLVTTTALRIRDQLTADLVADLGLEEFRSSRDLDAIARSVATPPFLAIRRVVVIWDPPQLAIGQRAAKEVELLGPTLACGLDTTAVLVVCRSTLPASSPFVQAVRAQRGEVRQLKRPKGRELRRYVDDEVRARRLLLGQPVLARLVDVAGQDLGRLQQELEKLEIYGLGQGRIADSDALVLVPPAPPAELYRLTDTLFEAPGRVGERLNDIAGRPDLPPPVVVGAVARAIRELLSFATDRRQSLPPWKEEKLNSHLKRAGQPRLRRWLVQLADLDWSTRTGAIDGQEGLELLLAQMASELRVRPLS
jgi:DNA polymerase III delta subunit